MKKFTRFRIATVATLSAAALALTGCAANSGGGSNKAVGGLDKLLIHAPQARNHVGEHGQEGIEPEAEDGHRLAKAEPDGQ